MRVAVVGDEPVSIRPLRSVPDARTTISSGETDRPASKTIPTPGFRACRFGVLLRLPVGRRVAVYRVPDHVLVLAAVAGRGIVDRDGAQVDRPPESPPPPFVDVPEEEDAGGDRAEREAPRIRTSGQGDLRRRSGSGRRIIVWSFGRDGASDDLRRVLLVAAASQLRRGWTRAPPRTRPSWGSACRGPSPAHARPPPRGAAAAPAASRAGSEADRSRAACATVTKLSPGNGTSPLSSS